MTKKNKHEAGKSQSARFIEAARDLGADTSEKRFKAIVRKVGSAPPAKNEPHPKAK